MYDILLPVSYSDNIYLIKKNLLMYDTHTL